MQERRRANRAGEQKAGNSLQPRGGRKRGDILDPFQDSPRCLDTGGPGLSLVVAKSACLRFRLSAKAAPAPLLLLSKPNPLRWASVWLPPAAALRDPFQDSPRCLDTGGPRLS